ncbi:MAG: hypothetical protein H7174_12195 [Flavobacterium sp.]|nr:hypothetical protein [Flavobacterium sp.]
MKKFILILMFLLTSIVSNSQVVVSQEIYYRNEKVTPENFKKFKATTTIFILSNIYEKEKYVKILTDSWKVTPFEVVNIDDFDFKNYLSDKYSFAMLNAKSWSEPGRGPILFSAIEFFILDNVKISKKIEKVKNDYNKFQDLIKDNKIYVAGIHLSHDFAFIDLTINNVRTPQVITLSFIKSEYNTRYFNSPERNRKNDLFIFKVYSEKCFLNYNLGYLKNYFQTVSSLISSEKSFELRETESNQELNNLRKEVLFVPDFVKLKFNPMSIKETELTSDEVNKIFSNYEYKYKLISTSDLETKILNKENFYYLDYVKVNNEKFVQIKNSLTGSIVLRYNDAAYNFKDNDMKKINKEINK